MENQMEAMCRMDCHAPVAEAELSDLVLQSCDKLSLLGKNFPNGLWECLSLSRHKVGSSPGDGINRYDMCLRDCAKRQKAAGAWSTPQGTQGQGQGSGSGTGGRYAPKKSATPSGEGK